MPISNAQAERRAKRFWVSLVVLLLAVQLAIGGVAIHLATSDPSAAAMPNYHTAALNWDLTRRASLAAGRMGWTIDVVISDVADTRGMRAAEVIVINDNDRPVDGLQVTGMAYHHARASEVQRFELKSVGQGRYLTLVPMKNPGLWQIDILLEGAEEPITKSAAIEVVQR